MTTRVQLRYELAKANRKLKRLEAGLEDGSVIYRRDTEKMIEALRDKAELLTNVSRGNLRIGGLQEADVDRYINILRRFNENELSTITGQKRLLNRTKRSFEENFSYTGRGKNKRIYSIPDKYYETLVRIFESDQFKKFKEKYGAYSNAIGAMVMEQRSYESALEFLDMVVNDTSGKFLAKGSENIDAKKFLRAWKSYDKRGKKK